MERKNTLEAIDRYVEAHADEVVEFLKDFIAIRSVTYEEGAAVAFFAKKLKAFGFDEVRIDPVGNVLGRVGNGKTTLLYDAHIDTVEPGNPAAWGMNRVSRFYPIRRSAIPTAIGSTISVAPSRCSTSVRSALNMKARCRQTLRSILR